MPVFIEPILDPNKQFTSVNVLLSFLLIVCFYVIWKLYTENKEKNNIHLEDLKAFDTENKKSNKELLEVLNKFHLSIEEGKLTDKSLSDKIERVISLLENKLNQR
jgi:amino acid permease